MKKLLAGTAFLVMMASCDKKVEDLPDASATGSNTFGASINGKLWAPAKFGVVPTADILEANFAGNNSYKINARNFGSSPTETEFEIFLVNVTGAGTYQLNLSTALSPNATSSYAQYVERRFQPKHVWMTDTQHTGTVTITRLDTAARVIAGTFRFTAADNYGGAAPLTVTDGRFDVKIK